MLAKDIKTHIATRESLGLFVFYFLGRPIAKVEVVGVATKIVRRPKSITFFVDDGTELLRCVQFLSGEADGGASNSLRVGDVVNVKGLLARAETNEEAYGFCLRVSLIEAVGDPHAEVFHWLTATSLNTPQVEALVLANAGTS